MWYMIYYLVYNILSGIYYSMTAPHVHRGVQMRGGKPTRHCHGDPSPPRPPAPTPPQTKVSVIKVAMRGTGKPWSYKGRHQNKKTVFFYFQSKNSDPPAPSPFFDHLSFFLIRIFWIGQDPPLVKKNLSIF